MAYAVLEIKSGGLHSWPPLLMYFCFWSHTPIELTGPAPSLLHSLTGLFLVASPNRLCLLHAVRLAVHHRAWLM